MAITKLTQYGSTLTGQSDYQAQNAHIAGLINQVSSQAFILSDPDGTDEPTIKQGTYINFGGSLYLVDTGDESISGTPGDGSVYIKLSGTTTLSAEFITDISGYSWSQEYGYFSDGTNMILPYLIVKSGTDWTKYRLDAHKGAIYCMNQDVRTSSGVEFGSVKIGEKTISSITIRQHSTSSINDDVSTTMGSMAVNELRMVSLQHQHYDTGDANVSDSFLYLPTSGTYFVLEGNRTGVRSNDDGWILQVSAREGDSTGGAVVYRIS